MRKKRNKRKKITQTKNKNTQSQVTQLKQAVITYHVRKRNDRTDYIFHATNASASQ